MDNPSLNSVTPVYTPEISSQDTPPDSQQQSLSTPPEEPTPNTIPVIIGFVTFILFLGATLFWQKYQMNQEKQANGSADTRELSSEVSPSPSDVSISFSDTLPEAPLFSGKLKRLNQDLKIFKVTEDDELNNISGGFTYYSAGVFLEGPLKDFTRVIALRIPNGPSGPVVFTLATKDFQTYVLHDPNHDTTEYAEDDWNNPYIYLDKTKITSTATFITEQPDVINLDTNFALFSTGVSAEARATEKLDENGYEVYEADLVLADTGFQKLAAPSSFLEFSFKTYSQNKKYFDQLSSEEKENPAFRDTYYLGKTEVVVTDSVGLPIQYSMTSQTNLKKYQREFPQNRQAWKQFTEQSEALQNNETSVNPVAPDYLYPPSLGFKGEEIKTQPNTAFAKTSFFKEYETAIPDACSSSLDTRVVSLKDEELEPVGNIGSVALYRLKDAKHVLNTLAYANKLDYYNESPEIWAEVNPTMEKPTFEQYVEKNPLLFFKDTWGRWVAVGEYDVILPGGCGKPVVYLYPSEPTKVTVQFLTPLQFTTAIPQYSGSWNVFAQPSGLLTDLQPDATDCQAIDTEKIGSEYAREACEKNQYPYLYWAGNVQGKDYPVLEKGWIIEKAKLETFLEKTLVQVGLSQTERNDFLEYWVPELLSKNAPYYRLSFFQTLELNSLVPMKINPQPDTVFRLFLDYETLVAEPQKLPEPQQLQKLNRQGFTVVEWGGLKKF